MHIRRKLTIPLAAGLAAVSLLVGGCDPNTERPKIPPAKAGVSAKAGQPAPAPGPDTQPAPSPLAACGAECAVPGPGQQIPAAPADPGPYNDIHQVVVRVWWIGDRSGFVSVLVNGAPVADREPAGTPAKGHDGKYHGGWLKVLHDVQSGQRIPVTFAPNGGRLDWIMIAVYYNAKTAVSTELGQPGCTRTLCIAQGVIG